MLIDCTRHCDSYIHDPCVPMILRWWLFIHRLPAQDYYLCRQNRVDPQLFATFEGERVQIVMACRLGDVGISNDFGLNPGYTRRVPIEVLSEFSDKP